MSLNKENVVIYDEEVRECIESYESWVTGLSITDDVKSYARVSGKVLNKQYSNFYVRGSNADTMNKIEMVIKESAGRLDRITFNFSLFDYWSSKDLIADKISFVKEKLKSIRIFDVEPEEKLSSGFNIKFKFDVYDSNRIMKVLSVLDEIMVRLIRWEIGN